MKRLIVIANRPLHLIDEMMAEKFYFSATLKDVEAKKQFEVPDNAFWRKKIQKENLLSLVGEKQDEVVEPKQEEVPERKYYRRKKQDA